MLDRHSVRFWAVLVVCLILLAIGIAVMVRSATGVRVRVHTKESLVQANPLLSLFSEGGSTEAIESTLKAHPEWTNVNFGNGTPLYAACGQGRADLVHYLVTHGADPNLTQSGNKETAIVQAVAARNLEIVKDLLAHGADPTVKDVYGRSLPWVAHEVEWPEGEQFLKSRIESKR